MSQKFSLLRSKLKELGFKEYFPEEATDLVESLLRRFISLSEMYQYTKSQLEASQKQSEDAQIDATSHLAELKSLRDRVKALKTEADLEKRNSESMVLRINMSEKKIRHVTNENTEMNRIKDDRIKALIEQNNLLTTTIDKFSARMLGSSISDSGSHPLSKRVAEVKAICEEMKRDKRVVDKLEDAFKKMEEKLNAYKEEVSQLRSKTEELELENKMELREIKVLRSDKLDLEQQLTVKTDLYQVRQREVDAQLAKLEEEAHKNSLLQEENAQLSQILKNMKGTHEQQMQEKEDEIHSHRDETHKLNMTLQDLQSIKETLEIDGENKENEIDLLKNAIYDLKKRAELGTVKPMVEYLSADRLKDLQQQASQSALISKQCHDTLVQTQRDLDMCQTQFKFAQRRIEELDQDLQASRLEAQQSKNQLFAISSENQNLKLMISALNNRNKDYAENQAMPMDHHLKIIEDYDKRARDLEAKLALATLQKIDLEKAYEENKNARHAKYSANDEDQQILIDDKHNRIKAQPIDHEMESTVKQSRPGFNAGVNPNKTTTAKPTKDELEFRGQFQVGTTLALKSKEMEVHQLKQEAQNIHKDLLEYRKLAIDLKDRNKVLEEDNLNLILANEDLQQTVDGMLENQKVLPSSPCDRTKSNLAGRFSGDEAGAYPRKSNREIVDRNEVLEQEREYVTDEMNQLRLMVDKESSYSKKLSAQIKDISAKYESLREENYELKQKLKHYESPIMSKNKALSGNELNKGMSDKRSSGAHVHRSKQSSHKLDLKASGEVK